MGTAMETTLGKTDTLASYLSFATVLVAAIKAFACFLSVSPSSTTATVSCHDVTDDL